MLALNGFGEISVKGYYRLPNYSKQLLLTFNKFET